MNIRTIPPGVPFLDALARWWLLRAEDGNAAGPLAQSSGLVLLPTRRAARTLTDAFIRIADGRPLLLPRIGAVGALDEAPLALHGVLDVPPAVDATERLAALTRLVMALEGRFGAPATADRAWPLAAELARLLDEAHREGVDLPAVLPHLAPAEYASHWGDTLRFLQIVTAAWPGWLRDNNRVDPADRAVRLLHAQADHWEAAPPGFPVVVAGTAGGNAALARLMRVVARLPGGMVVLPGVDTEMDAETWDALDASHAQAGLRALLAAMGATRDDVRPWDGPASSAGRAALLNRALLPARALGQWRDPGETDHSGLERLRPADEQEEAVAIALVLREALEQPHAQAALVTPDRALAGRVAAELGRFGVVVDDSAGEPLAETPPGAFLRLLVGAVAADLSPVALLSVLKHPFAAFGLPAAACRAAARRLERRLLRGSAPPPGLAGLRAALWSRARGDAEDDGVLADLLDRLQAGLGPLLALTGGAAVPPDAALRALVRAAEAAAATDTEDGATRLWAREEGEAVAQHLAALLAALPLLPPQPVSTLPGLLDASFEGAVVRTRRALRGRDGAEHPRVAILGLLEARLQSFDTLVLGSLAETVWPPATDPGPWMSRPMRREAGLASPEQVVGQMAHDFATLACAAPHVVLSCPLRREGAPAVPARWLVRLEAFLRGRQESLQPSPAAAWARLLDQPEGEPAPVAPPRPCPPVQLRPRQLSVTEVETWLRDPYGIYARHVLRLRALDPLEETVDNADFGTVVHAAVAAWLQSLPPTYPEDAADRLRAEMALTLDGQALRPALVTWWTPRLARIADWVATTEGERRLRARAVVGAELRGEWALPGVSPPFTLTGRADRIERLPDGTLSILDYKTGTVPKAKAVEAGYAPQLPLEAAMAADGAFGPDARGTVAELAYWRLTGDLVPGEETRVGTTPDAVAALTDTARDKLAALVRRFDDPAQPYLSQPNPGEAPRFTDYAQLARVAEWSAAGEEDARE